MDILSFIDSFNWQTIIGMFAIAWYFNREIKLSLEKQSSRTDKLYEMFIDLLKDKK